MPNFVNNTVTVNGEGQIAAAMAGIQLVITRVQVGSGVAAPSVPPPTLTALVNPVMNLIPVPPQVSANNLQEGEVVVMSTLDSANVTAAFNLTELGIWAKSGGGPEQLIVYCQCSAPYDNIAPGSGSNRLQLNLQVPIVVGFGASVMITVQAGNPVYIPPVVAGPGIVVDAPTDTSGRVIEWIVSTKQITNNTTLYVANEYTQNIAPNFSSLPNAMNYLSTFAIASGVQVSISMKGEVFHQTTTTYISHANASQIGIYGQINPDVTFNGIGTVTGSAGNWKIQLLKVSSTQYIAVGTWLNIYNVGWGWPNTLIAGVFQVTAVAGSTVTIQSFYYGSTHPNVATVAGAMTPLTTVISQDSSEGQHGLHFTNGIGFCENIAIINPPGQATNWDAVGIILSGTGTFIRCGTWGFRSNTSLALGVEVVGPASGIFEYCTSSLNDDGFVSSGTGANLYLVNSASSHNLCRGLWAEAGGTIGSTVTTGGAWVYIGGNRERGALVQNSSYIFVLGAYIGGALVYSNMMFSYNASYGVHINAMSKSAFSTPSDVFWCAFNGQYDVAATSLSLISGSGAIQGTRLFNATPGILTADGSLFN